MSRMASMEKLLAQILPQTMPCPRSMALDALQMVAVDFFRESGVWVETFQEPVGCHETVITPAMPKTAALSGVSSVYLNDLEIEEYLTERHEIILAHPPRNACLATIRATLRPLRTSTELPEDLLETYGDYLAFGAIAKLKTMSGNKVEWHDPQGAAVNYQLYTEGLARAQARKFRKRFGGVLYVQTGEWE